jgi:hypothetical protein
VPWTASRAGGLDYATVARPSILEIDGFSMHDVGIPLGPDKNHMHLNTTLGEVALSTPRAALGAQESMKRKRSKVPLESPLMEGGEAKMAGHQATVPYKKQKKKGTDPKQPCAIAYVGEEIVKTLDIDCNGDCPMYNKAPTRLKATHKCKALKFTTLSEQL